MTGTADKEHSSFILNEIKQTIEQEEHGAPIYYIVPDQMTFQQEYAFFSNDYVKGSIRMQVSSFSRLALRVLQETGGGTRKFISSVGIQMMLRKIIEEKTDDWRMFQKAIEKQGFLAQLETMITEFKRYDVTPDVLKQQQLMIDQYVHKTPAEVSLMNKLDDLTYIYEKLAIALQGTYIDNEDQLDMLTERILETDYFQDAEIYLDGFYRFTPKELNVIGAFMQKCKRVTIALKMDPEDVQEVQDLKELDLFYQTKETYHILKQMIETYGISEEKCIVLTEQSSRYSDKPYLQHLEKNFDTRPVPAYEGQIPIRIREAVHPRAEVEGVAQEILDYVRNDAGRFKDIVIYMRDAEMYQDVIDTVFEDYEIPVFIDEKKTMLNHPFIEFIRSLMDMVEGNWRYDAVFRVLKTGFIPAHKGAHPLTYDAIDELENYVLEYGIRSRERWFSKEPWTVQRFRGFEQAVQTKAEEQTEERIHAYRKQIVHALESFDRDMQDAKTVKERCIAIYKLLEHLNVVTRLEETRDEFDVAGEIEKGREQEQVWDAVIDLFDEIVEIAGDEAMSLSVFRATLEAGLETLNFAHVPPAMDQVMVGTIDRSRISEKQYVFLLGVNDGLWPLRPAGDGMINEEEREMLHEHGIQLAQTSRRQLLDDWFYMYLAFTTTSHKLWVSYLLSDEEGRAKMPSQLIGRLEEMFPQREETLLLQDPEELVDAKRFITTPVTTRAALSAQLARHEKGYPMRDIWFYVLNWYTTHEKKYDTTYNILQSLVYDNKPVQLEQETVERIYPKEVKTSISRLENYYRCSYQHFAQYTLGLKERRTYKLDAPDIGQLFHEALKIITEWIQKEGRDYQELTERDTTQYAKRAVSNLAPILQNQILHSSKRYEYIQKKLEEVIARATYVLSEQARMTQFSPVGLELSFGMGEALEPVRMTLSNGYELLLRGRIDRVDRSQINDQLYLRIIDYKSSEKDLNLVEVYYGLALQMLMYLDVVLKQSEQWLGLEATPAGVLYFHVHNPIVSGDGMLDDERLEQEIFKKYKMNGLLLAEETVAEQMDTTLDAGVSSQMIPAGIKKDGSFNARSKIASVETFTKLQNHIKHLIMDAGVDITSGGVHLDPFQYKQQTACDFCEFKSVCQFDPTLETNTYHKLREFQEKQIIEMMNEEGE